MTEQIKLDAGQKHILSLIRKESDADGWAPVSRPVAQLWLNPKLPWRAIPPELCEFESVGDEGCGRARLTQEGNNLLNAMAWL